MNALDFVRQTNSLEPVIKLYTSTAQALKLLEEAGELAQAHLKKRDDEGRDAVGDILVVLTIYCQQKGWSIAECFQMAWNEIKDRKGKMVDGSFVKEEDLA